MEFERVQILLENQWADMAGSGGQWDYQDVTVSLGDDGAVIVRTDGTLLRKLRLYLEERPVHNARVLGDAWERGYADLEWRSPDGTVNMPWYFFAWDGTVNHCYGVKTGPNALCFWQFDGNQAVLTLD